MTNIKGLGGVSLLGIVFKGVSVLPSVPYSPGATCYV